MWNVSNLVKVLGVVIMCFAFVPAQAAESETPKNISKILQGMSESFTSAQVVVVNPVPLYPYRINESEMHRIGCHFEAKRKEDIASLVDVLSRGEIVEAPPYFHGGKQGIGARLGIYFYKGKDVVAKLIINTLSPAPRQEYGWFGEDTSVRTMNPSFAIDLREWAAMHGSLGTNYCDLFKGEVIK